MHYVYVSNGVVTDQSQIDPSLVFNSSYASMFVEASDNVTFNWRFVNGEFLPPAELTPEEKQAQNKSVAIQLLQQTDWSSQPSIINPTESNPYLMNQPEFLQYRSNVRAISINPPTELLNFPSIPEAIWSNS